MVFGARLFLHFQTLTIFEFSWCPKVTLSNMIWDLFLCLFTISWSLQKQMTLKLGAIDTSENPESINMKAFRSLQ